MKNKYLACGLLGLAVLVQLYMPANMILEQEDVLTKGKEYKFQVAPVDPSDPFRGKYISLQYRHNAVQVSGAAGWQAGETVYLHFYQDQEGFARIWQVSRSKPAPSFGYLKAHIAYIEKNKAKTTLFIRYPFDRFYMEESKAYPAEQAYTASVQDTSQKAYALVAIKAGKGVLKDVRINDISIREKVLADRQDR